jgi:hypothetical protein
MLHQRRGITITIWRRRHSFCAPPQPAVICRLAPALEEQHVVRYRLWLEFPPGLKDWVFKKIDPYYHVGDISKL